MKRAQVQSSLLEAFRLEFAQQAASVRRQWEEYTPKGVASPEDLSELRRDLHTIKGSVRLLEFAGLPEQVHLLEELVDGALRSQTKPEQFLERWEDFEESVAQALGEGTPTAAMTSSTETMAVAPRQREAAGASAYGLLLGLDEILGMGEELSERLDDPDHAMKENLVETVGSLVERLRILREAARKMALVPSYELFSGLSELARRTALESGKQVRVVVRATEDLLEREVVLSLRPALIHLIGNAVSHGVDGASGVLELDYRRVESGIQISVSDRGGGLDLQKLKEAVLRAGHVDEVGWQEMSGHQRQQWIFFPGLSTRGEADLTSGRGMGLAVVAETVQRLSGTVDVESGPQGTTFRLKIPTGWEVRSVLRVSSGGQDFAVLSSELEAVSQANESRINAVWLGELANVLGYPATTSRRLYSLLINRQGDLFSAVGVDSLGSFDEVLVRPLIGFSGVNRAMIGVTPTRGLPIPVVSLQALVGGQEQETPALAPAVAAAPGGPLLLVVDDSMTTRTLVSGILSSQGYEVLLAQDGQEALELSRTPGLALVVSDYQMPIVDGLEFLEQFRADPITAKLPFILLTSIDDVATFEKASALGADRCLGKQNFSQDRLLGLVEELL